MKKQIAELIEKWEEQIKILDKKLSNKIQKLHVNLIMVSEINTYQQCIADLKQLEADNENETDQL